jgi:aspartate-semialdehyde dehydrogenase
MNRVKCAILGASGVVGQNFLRLLVDHPYFELVAICASDARKGSKLGQAKEVIDGGIPEKFANMVFDTLDVKNLVNKDVQVAFSALPADTAINIEKDAAREGIKVFSNASSYRMDPNVPILIPEINAAQLDIVKLQQKETKGFIVTNANCTTTGLTMALLPLLGLKIKRLIVASYQAISGAGYPGLPFMDISNNVIPYISNEEPKLVAEAKKICGQFNGSEIVPQDWQIYAHCVRVQTVIGHLISVHMELENETSKDKIENLIKNYKAPSEVAGLPTAPDVPVIYTEDVDRPQPRYDVNAGSPARTAGMAVVIGRLDVDKNIIRFVTLSNNLVRGAAGGSVLNAELAYKRQLL